MPTHVRFFSLICFLLTCFFLSGILYLWYPYIRTSRGGEVLAPTIAEEHPRNAMQVASRTPEETTVEEDSQYQVLVTSSPAEMVDDIEFTNTATLPSEIHLPVPFTSQAPEGNWEEPWQDACEEAAILMLDAYYKQYNLSPLFAKDELLKMVDWETERNWGYSIPMSEVQQVAEWYMGNSFSFRIIEHPSIEELKQELADRNPVLVVAYGKALENPYFSGDGPAYHALIIRGYTEVGFITNDPGTKHGEAFVYPYHTLMDSMHDWNDGDVEAGKPVVLIVEK